MTNATLTIAVLQRIAEFLESLPETDVADLAEGRARLAIIPAGATEPRPAAKAKRGSAKPAAATVDMSETVAALAQATTREEGAQLIAVFSAADVKALATALGMSGVSKLTKPALTERIIEQTIGFRLNSSSIRQV